MDNKIYTPLDELAYNIARCIENDFFFDDIKINGITYDIDVDYEAYSLKATGTSFMGINETYNEVFYNIKGIKLVSATNEKGEDVTSKVVLNPQNISFKDYDNINY